MDNTVIRCDQALKPYPKNIGTFFFEQCEKTPDQTILLQRKPGEGQFTGLSWRELRVAVEAVCHAFLNEGLTSGQKIAILSENRSEMLVVELAAFCLGLVATPIFSGYFSDQVNFLLRHSESRLLFVADAQQHQKVDGPNLLPQLKKILVFSDENMAGVQDARVQGFSPWLAKAASPKSPAWRQQALDLSANAPAFLMYTSGTTGDPKGVLLSHRNVLSQHQGISQVWDFGPEDRLLSYLPWHHCFGGIFEVFLSLYNNIPMAIDGSRGKDFELLIENWGMIRPTIYLSVPAIYQAMVTKIKQNPDLKPLIFHSELRAIFTAAAPLPPALYDIFAKEGVKVHEGWGLTESTPDITVTRPDRSYKPGIVGDVLPGVEIKLSVEGEVLARGPNIMLGYFKNPESTRRAIDDQGWLHTGDLGEFTPDGLRIIGRADGVFKLVNGEKVPSALIEGQLVSHVPFINRACVVGRGRLFLVAILFVNEVELLNWARNQGLEKPLHHLVEEKAVRDMIAAGVEKTNSLSAAKYHHIKAYHVTAVPPSLERGELTPTSKLCAPRVQKNYAAIIERLFA